MKLRGIDFPPVMNASGAQNFFGQGYPFHGYWRLLGLTFKRCGFVAKTTTLHSRAGNMPLKDTWGTPANFLPSCIRVNFLKGIVLNAVGLSGPGAESLFLAGQWQRHEEPFFLSFMSVAKTPEERLQELREFVAIFRRYLPEFASKVGLELNFSCPNTGHQLDELSEEMITALDVSAQLDIPLQVKLNPLAHARVAKRALEHEACDALTMGNTIPWGALPDEIPWAELFGSTTSPLAQYGGGALSGKPVLPIIQNWIKCAREEWQIRKPIWVCNGIQSVQNVPTVAAIGGNGIQIGSVGILRPWRMKGIIAKAYETFTSL